MDCIKKQFETLGINHQSDTIAEAGATPPHHPAHKHERDGRHQNHLLNGNSESKDKYTHRGLHNGDRHHLFQPHRNPHRYRRSQFSIDAAMANEEELSRAYPHPPQNYQRYSGSKVDSEQYYHNPFYYRNHRNGTNRFKSGDNTSRGFSFKNAAVDDPDILYEEVDGSINSESDIPQFQIPQPPMATRRDNKEDHLPSHHQPLYHHHYEPPRGRDRRPRPNTNTTISPWPDYPPPPPPLVRQTPLVYPDMRPSPDGTQSPSSTISSPRRQFDRRLQPKTTKRFSAAAAAPSPPTDVPRPRKAAPHHPATGDEAAPPPPVQSRPKQKNPHQQHRQRQRLSPPPPLFPLPAPTTTVGGGSSSSSSVVVVAGRGMKRSVVAGTGAGSKSGRAIKRDSALAPSSPHPLYFAGCDDDAVPPPEATTPTIAVDGTELSLRRGGGVGSLLDDDDDDDDDAGGFDEGAYEECGYEYVGPADYAGEAESMPVDGGCVDDDDDGLWSPGREVSSIRTFTVGDGGGGGSISARGKGEDGFVADDARGRGRGFFDYAEARARRKGERVAGTGGHPVTAGGGGHGRPGRGASPRGRAGFEIIRGGGWEMEQEPEPEPELYLFDIDDEETDGHMLRDWPLGGRAGLSQYLNARSFSRAGRHVGGGRGVDSEDHRAKDKRKHRYKRHSDSNRTSTPSAPPKGLGPTSTAGPLSTIRAPRTPSEVAGCALGTAAVGLCATSVKKVVSQAIRWEVEKQVQERLQEEKMERRRRRARKREEKEKKWRERDRLEREAIIARRENGRPGFARRLSDKVPQRFRRAMSGPSGLGGPSLSGASKMVRDDTIEDGYSGDHDLVDKGLGVMNDRELYTRPRRGWRRGWSRSRTPEPRRPLSQRPKLPEELWRRGGHRWGPPSSAGLHEKGKDAPRGNRHLLSDFDASEVAA
ncbi:uncharacterized protein BKCO1_3100027 [Diplodia corticola]|uniref:Uncharacterized protein n=1 Tax=Diplodia corticola TaxID=236234 RepID=A0A1J9RL31_9PEZI|nr:uncharacterized protein BKCO1_3100027 [Diplodia corticola]OJD33291.1 hypothetical protein BKCO1_3100027 [Diplodia corticola]